MGAKKIHYGSIVFLFEQLKETFLKSERERCHELVNLLGTNNQDNVIRTRKPTPTPIVPAVPIWPSIERPTKAPRNKATAAISLWSRVMTRWRNLKRRGSDMSSTHTVVNTTTDLSIWRINICVYIYALVVPNCVFRRLPSIPCTPRLALMKAKPTKDNAFVQAGSSRALDILGWPAFQNATALAIVKRAWMNVPAMSHIRLCAPTRSPIRPTNAPRLKLIKEHNACWSALWNVWSWDPGVPSKRRASAIANYYREKINYHRRYNKTFGTSLPGQNYRFGNHTKRRLPKKKQHRCVWMSTRWVTEKYEANSHETSHETVGSQRRSCLRRINICH